MKEFRTIQDALDYRVECPICNSRLCIDKNEVDMRLDTDYKRPTLTWSSPDSKLCIDLETNAVLSYTLTRSMSPVYGIGSNAPLSYIAGQNRINITSDGHLMERIVVGCEDCHQYYYVLQVVVQTKPARLEALFLNSEFLAIDERGTTHEIRNVYSFEKTEYNRFINRADDTHTTSHYIGDNTVSLPLIPLDLENPHKTLERIKTLVLFS